MQHPGKQPSPSILVHGLSPEGRSVLLKSMEMCVEHVGEIVERFVDKDWIIVDTPGQLEIFMYHSAGRRISDILQNITRTIALS
ncbi:MAG: hypothetical protein DRN20_06000 [Thermoplasmata archaeon]|nr:MAG: hypothetical protein DRN20_06000 [Thermoplasmata archaeon]